MSFLNKPDFDPLDNVGSTLVKEIYKPATVANDLSRKRDVEKVIDVLQLASCPKKIKPKVQVKTEANSESKSSNPNPKVLDESNNYSKLQLAEQILKRPDTYVGSCELDTEEMWIFNDSTKRMEKRLATYSPALFKIFDEIIVNAADNKQRDPTMDKLKVTIVNNEITVYNSGKGIPIQIHSTENVYIPQLIFGELLTSSNYNDTEKRITGGRNGEDKLKPFVLENGTLKIY